MAVVPVIRHCRQLFVCSFSFPECVVVLDLLFVVHFVCSDAVVLQSLSFEVSILCVSGD